MWDERDLAARLMLSAAEARLLLDLLGNKLKDRNGAIEFVYFDEPQLLAAGRLVRAGMAEFAFLNGMMKAATGIRLTQLGHTAARFFEVLEEKGEEAAEAAPKERREYAVDGSNGKFHLREFVNTVQQGSTPVETFTTRKQAEHVAALLNEALTW